MNELPWFLVEVTLVFALALLSVRLASGARAAVRHLILASAFGVVLVLPLARLVSPELVVELPARTAEPVAAPAIVAAPVDVEPRSNPATPAARIVIAHPVSAAPIPATTWLLLIWAVVALVALVPVGASLMHLRSIRRRGIPWADGTARMSAIAHAAGMRPSAVLLHDRIAGPITSGILRPVVVLPPQAVTWSETHIANALVHELAHVRRRDWPVHLIARSVCALYWFHPLAWLTWRALRLEAERACDDAVLAREDAATYADQLLALARQMVHMPAPGLSMASGSNLSTRVSSILDNMRPRGRAGKVMIGGIVLAAVVALAVLTPLRVFEARETRMYRAADLLANRTDADSLAAAGALIALKDPDQALKLLAQATLLAPERADLAWLHIQLCQAVASCDPEPLERRLRSLDEKNGAAWLVALERAGKRGDEEATSAALAAIGRSGRMDIYWTTLIARLSPPVAGTRKLSAGDAQIAVIGSLAARSLPGYRVITEACSRERLMRDDVLELCRGVADSMLNGDVSITESIGAGIAKRAWPENSPKWAEANEVRRIWDQRVRFAKATNAWFESHPRDHLTLLEQNRREQDVYKAVLIATGNNPNVIAVE